MPLVQLHGLAQPWWECFMARDMWWSAPGIPVQTWSPKSTTSNSRDGQGFDFAGQPTLFSFGLGPGFGRICCCAPLQIGPFPGQVFELATCYCLCRIHGMGWTQQKDNWHRLVVQAQIGHGIDSLPHMNIFRVINNSTYDIALWTHWSKHFF